MLWKEAGKQNGGQDTEPVGHIHMLQVAWEKKPQWVRARCVAVDWHALMSCDFNLPMRDPKTWGVFVFKHKQSQCNASTGSTTLHVKLPSSPAINFVRQLYVLLDNGFSPYLNDETQTIKDGNSICCHFINTLQIWRKNAPSLKAGFGEGEKAKLECNPSWGTLLGLRI